MTFTGTARDLIVPAGGFCQITGATIARDLIQQDESGAEVSHTTVGHDVVFGGEESGADISDSSVGHDVVAAGIDSGAAILRSTIGHDFLGLGQGSGADLSGSRIAHDFKQLGSAGVIHMELSTIGHDFYASRPDTVQSGRAGHPANSVEVGHDLTIDGSPDPFVFAFDGLCNLHVARDLTIANRTVNFGIGVGGNCADNGKPPNTVGRDLIVTGNTAVPGFFGPSSIKVGGNHVGRDLVFTNNTAEAGGSLGVSDNTVGRDATCAGNTPAATAGTPNTVGRSNTCG
jgi:hypothetical protein